MDTTTCWDVQNEIKLLNHFKKYVIPFEYFLDNTIDTVKFDYANLLCYLLKVYGLTEVMMLRIIELAISLDGADLKKKSWSYYGGYQVN